MTQNTKCFQNHVLPAADFSAFESGLISTLFDVGGIVGSITAGILSDATNMPATVCFWLNLITIPLVSA